MLPNAKRHSDCHDCRHFADELYFTTKTSDVCKKNSTTKYFPHDSTPITYYLAASLNEVGTLLENRRNGIVLITLCVFQDATL